MGDRLQQVNFRFSAVEDRLILTVTTEGRVGYRFWLTRRFVRLFWNSFLKTLEATTEVKGDLRPQAKRAVIAFEKEASVRGSDFSRRLDEKNLTFPLGEAATLATKVKWGRGKGDSMRLTLEGADGKAIDLRFGRQQLYSICHLLIVATRQTDWDLNLSLGDAELAMPEGPARLH